MKLVCLVLFLLLSPTPGYLAPPGDPLPLRDTATPGHAAPPEGTAPPGDAALPISPSLEGTVPPGDVETPGHAGGGNGEAVMTGLEGGGSRDVREKLHTNVKQDVEVPPPTSLQLLFINISAVLITWDYPNGDGDPLPIQFAVLVRHANDPYGAASKQLLTDMSFVYEGMLFAGYYQFQVLAYFEGVASKPAESDSFINGESAPPGPPLNIRAILVSPGEVSLEWDPPPTPSPLLYTILWGDQLSCLDKKEVIYQTTHHTFSNLAPATVYYYSMSCSISGHQSILSETVNLTTPPTSLPAPVILNHTQSWWWVWLEWTVPTHLYPLYYTISNFTICYRNQSTPSSDFTPSSNLTPSNDSLASWKNHSDLYDLSNLNDLSNSDLSDLYDLFSECVVVAGGQRSANLTGLDSGVDYLVVVMYVSTGLPGRRSYWSEELLVGTEFVPSVRCLSCVPLSATQLLLHWQLSGNISLLQFSVDVYSLSDENATLLTTINTSLAEGNLTLYDLRPWTSYHLVLSLPDLSPLNSSDLSPLAQCPRSSCFTMEGTPSLPPSHLHSLLTSSRSLTLQWTPPPSHYLHGNLTHYLLSLTCHSRTAQSALLEGTWQQSGENICPNNNITMAIARTGSDWSRDVTYTLDNLRPATIYGVMVAAATGAGEGPYSAELNLTTTEEILESPLHSLTLNISTRNSTTSVNNNNNNNNNNVCRPSLLLTWSPSLQYEGKNSSRDYDRVSFLSHSISSLSTEICYLSFSQSARDVTLNDSICASLNSTNVIAQRNKYSVPYEELFGGTNLTRVTGGVVTITWLELWAGLENGSSLHVRSENVTLRSLEAKDVDGACTISGDEGHHLDLPLMSGLLLLAFSSAFILLMVILAILAHKHYRKRRHAQIPVDLPLLDSQVEGDDPVISDYTTSSAMRVGDGRSFSSGSHTTSNGDDIGDDLSSVTMTTDTCSTATLDEFTHMNASRLNIRPDVGVVMGGANMCGREEPDGCSVSSGSDESLIDIVTKD